jgi:hypothetical protein
MGRVVPLGPQHAWIIKQKLPENLPQDAILQNLWFGGQYYDPDLDQQIRRPPIIPKRMQAGYDKNAHVGTLTNGSTFQIKSIEQSVDKFASENPDVIWMDEPSTTAAWMELQYRLVRNKNAHVIMTLTPASVHASYLDELVNGNDDRVLVEELWTENNHYMSPEHLQYVIDNTPEDQREMRLHGKLAHLSGLIYHEWDNWVEPFVIPDSWSRYVVHDPGISNPAATLWMAVSPQRELFCYDCDYDTSKKSNIRDLCDRILAKSAGQPIVRWYIDPFAAAQRVPSAADPRNEETIAHLYRSCGVPVTLAPRQQELAGRWQRINVAKLCIDTKNKRHPNVFAFNSKKMDPLRKELRLYRWETNETAKRERNLPDQPHKQHDHLMYCLETACALASRGAITHLTPHELGEIEQDWQRHTREMDEQWHALAV